MAADFPVFDIRLPPNETLLTFPRGMRAGVRRETSWLTNIKIREVA
ncbi:MAG: hypothetical protein ACYCZB_12020 [Acidiphilium sp.]